MFLDDDAGFVELSLGGGVGDVDRGETLEAEVVEGGGESITEGFWFEVGIDGGGGEGQVDDHFGEFGVRVYAVEGVAVRFVFDVTLDEGLEGAKAVLWSVGEDVEERFG